jgi:hypothetical protein
VNRAAFNVTLTLRTNVSLIIELEYGVAKKEVYPPIYTETPPPYTFPPYMGLTSTAQLVNILSNKTRLENERSRADIVRPK